MPLARDSCADFHSAVKYGGADLDLAVRGGRGVLVLDQAGQELRAGAVARADATRPYKLMVGDQNAQTQLGTWALDLASIGRAFAHEDLTVHRTLALRLPTLEFAAALIGAGYVAAIAEAQARLQSGATNLQDDLFDQLCSLREGAPVSVKINLKDKLITVLGRFHRLAEVFGERAAIIEYQTATKTKGGASRAVIRRQDVDRVFFSVQNERPVDDRRVGRTISFEPGLAESFVRDRLALSQLLLHQSRDCVIVGVIRSLTEELYSSRLQAVGGPDEKVAVGRLQDIVRASNFLNAQDPSRSELLAVRGVPDSSRAAPKLVIFRGSAAYVHRASHFPDSHHIVLVSPIESDFDVAVTTLNEAALNSCNDVVSNIAIPFGVRGMMFSRRPPIP